MLSVSTKSQGRSVDDILVYDFSASYAEQLVGATAAAKGCTAPVTDRVAAYWCFVKVVQDTDGSNGNGILFGP
jgi:hypothetical protein